MAIGDVGSIIASFEFDTSAGFPGDIAHVAGDVYVIAYASSPGIAARIRTVSISDGAISGITTYTHGTYSQFPKILPVDGNVFAVCWRSSDTLGTIQTFSISDDGTTITPIASINYETADSYNQSFIPIAGTIYCVCYQGPGGDGWLKTVSISNDGATLSLTGASLEFDGVQAAYPDIIPIAGTVYAIVYQGPGDVGILRTVSISDDGLTISNITFIQFDGAYGELPKIRHVSDTIYAIYYRGGGALEGLIKTVSISNDGTTLSLTGASLAFEGPPAPVGGPSGFIRIAANTYAAAYWPGGGIAGRVRTFNISDDGLTINTIDFGDFSAIALTWGGTDIIYVSGDVYAVIWSGTLQDGYISTVDIETIAAASVSTDPASSILARESSLNGTLDDDGGEACDCGFEWGLTIAYGNTTPTQSRTTGQTFDQTISSLSPNTLYHFRAFATNAHGTSYGADQTFTTLAAGAGLNPGLVELVVGV